MRLFFAVYASVPSAGAGTAACNATNVQQWTCYTVVKTASIEQIATDLHVSLPLSTATTGAGTDRVLVTAGEPAQAGRAQPDQVCLFGR
jgi:hypothetical protein